MAKDEEHDAGGGSDADRTVADAERTISDADPTRTPEPPSTGAAAAPALPDLGPKFEVLGLIGRGGMGAVYRVRHRKLDHVRAVKVLVSGADPVALERLRREAAIATGLAHPNIVSVYDLEELADGSLAIVMEHLAGQDLVAYNRSHGRMSLDEVQRRFAGVADALDRMHAAGVIHRDLKPANLFVCDGGEIKILDFGISRVVAEETRLTQTGAAVGTPAFMAPEQFEDREVTPAADLYALGSVLFACLTGEAPIKGSSQAELIANVLFQPPARADEVCADVPSSVAAALERALAKDPEQRFPTAAALLRALAGDGAGIATDATTLAVPRSAARPAASPERTPTGWWRRAGLVVAVVALAALLAWWSWPLGGGAPAPLPDPVITQLTFDPGAEMGPTLSPDGGEVVYSDGTDLLLRRVGGQGSVNLTAAFEPAAREPAWSPGGEEIAFVAGSSLYVMGALGERVRKVLEGAYWPSWSPDGREIAYSTYDARPPYVLTESSSDLRVVDVVTGESRDVLTGRLALMPDWSPDGQRIVFVDNHQQDRGTWTVRTDGRELQRVSEHRLITPRWSRDGRAVYGLAIVGDAMAVVRLAVDPRDGGAASELETVLRIPAVEAWHLALAAEADVWVFTTVQHSTTLSRVELGPGAVPAAGPLQPITHGSQDFTSPDLSPDGALVAFVSQGREQDLWVAAPDGSDPRPLSSGASRTRTPRWSPDGETLVFDGARDDVYGVYTVRADGSGLRRLSGASARYRFPQYSPDGTRLVVSDEAPRPIVIDLSRDWDEQIPAEPDPDALGWVATSWASDGRWLAVSTSTRLGRMDAASGAVEELLDHGFWPVWMADDRRLLVAEDDRVFVFDTETGAEAELFSVAPGRFSMRQPLALSADDRTVVVSVDHEDVDVWTADFEGD